MSAGVRSVPLPPASRPPEPPASGDRKPGIFSVPLLRAALRASVRKLSPRAQARNPVMFVVYVGTVVTLILTVQAAAQGRPWAYELTVTALLALTVLLANLAEGLAEARGKAQAASLRSAREDVTARRLTDGREETVPGGLLRRGDLIVAESGDLIPADGEIVEGLASVDESAITGESAPVIREAGTDHSGVTGGTRVLSDRIVVRVTSGPGESFLDRMIALVEGASRQKTPNEIALGILLSGLTLVFLLATVTLYPFTVYAGAPAAPVTLVALLVCLIPTTIGGLLPAIGIAGMDRALQANVIAGSGKAVEVAGDVDVLLLDKTGTITVGNRLATDFRPLPGVDPADLMRAALLSSLQDPTPEGRSIVALARERGVNAPEPAGAEFVEFSAQTRMSGVDFVTPAGPVSIRKGAGSRVADLARERGAAVPPELTGITDAMARGGATPLVVIENSRLLGAVALSDIIKPGIRDRFAQLRRMGLRTVMITGDNPLTAAAIAREAGVDSFLAEATPEDKLAMIREEQRGGRLVAMMGDGTNDAPALAQADVGLAMNSGTQAAREAGNMVDLDSDPTKLLEIIEIGKGLLITRGALTTFSVANDVAKYFAILPALFVTAYPELGVLNVMQLHSPASAVLSAVIFNALIIPALVPLALRGVPYRPMSAASLLSRNLLVYGLGGLLLPFVAIKVTDLLITPLF